MIKFVNFRASDIEPNPNEVLYWVDLNEDPTGGSIKYWNEKGYWQTIRVLEGSLWEFEEKIKTWVTEELQKQTEQVEDQIHQFDGRIAIIEGNIQNLYTVKQDKLIPGYGIEITEDNTINCTVDLSLYRVVAELPTEDIDESKIYIVFDPDGTGTNTHEEYVYVDGKWELLGKYADYASRTELQQEIADRKAADQQLQQNIDAEIERATNKETVLQSALTKEISDRQTEIDRVEQLIIDESQIREESIAQVGQVISEEVARATAAEERLTQDLNAEIERSTTIDGTHTNKISALETKATELEEEIDAEVNRATAKETELNEAITNEISRATQKESEIETSLNQFKSTKGQFSGLASLDENGRVPSSQLPSYVDDVIEADTLTAFPETGESGKIYIAKDTNKTYRWSGTDYTEISASLALGETSSTAYAGDKGKVNRDAISSLPDRIVNTFPNVSATATAVNVTGGTFVEKSGLNYGAEQAISTRTIPAATTTTAGVMTAADKAKLDGISSGANTYTHPAGSAPSKPVGLYKISTDANSHIASTTAVTKADITALGIPGSDTNTTYTFANGTDGSFTVTPSGGSAQKVTIGKPATAGTADTAIDCVKKTGDTMTGTLRITQGSSLVFEDNTELNNCGDIVWHNSSGEQRARIYTPVEKGISHGLYLCGSTSPDMAGGGVLFLKPDTIKFQNKIVWYEGNLSPVTTNTTQTITKDKLFTYTSSEGNRYTRYSGNGIAMYCDTPSWACGLMYYNNLSVNSSGTTKAGIGALGTNKGAITGLYMGIGDAPYSRFQGLFITTDNITFKNNKIWHAGNDGSGSGLDADTLDGIDGTQYHRSINYPSEYIHVNSFIGYTDDSKVNYYLFGEAVTDTAKNGFTFSGKIMFQRGNYGQFNSFKTIYLNVSAQYLTNIASFFTNCTNSDTSDDFKFAVVTYDSKKFLALEIAKDSQHAVFVEGIVKGTTKSDTIIVSADSVTDVDYDAVSQNNYINCVSKRVVYPITFTGAVTGTYNGSAAKTVNIPAASTRASLGLNTTDAVVFAKVTASGGFWKESDKRLKSNIKPLQHTIEQITSIPTVEFDMNDKHQIGTIAQDIETVVPEVVSESDGIKKVEYSMMGVLAIEGIKLLKQEIEDLKKEIELLKNK